MNYYQKKWLLLGLLLGLIGAVYGTWNDGLFRPGVALSSISFYGLIGWIVGTWLGKKSQR